MSPKFQRALILGLIFIGVLIVGFFGLRATFALRDFRNHPPPPPPAAEEAQPMETNVELIRNWMTIPYIAKTYQLHPKILYDALGISPSGNEEKSLLQLNEEFFPHQPGIVLELVKALVQANLSGPRGIIPDTPAAP